MAVRLKDIAADLGVSSVTVSKVLRNQPDVGEDTRRRVLQRIKELNYTPNLLARGLASGKSQTVGLIVPNLTHTFFAEFAKCLKAGLRTRGYQLVLASSDEEPEMEREEIDNLLARGVDAMLVASCQSDSTGLAGLSRSGVPYGLVDRLVPGFPSPFVGTDDVAAGRLATAHLIQAGSRRIAHIAGAGLSTARDRLLGYQLELQAAGLPYDADLVVCRSRLEEVADDVGYSEIRRLLRLKRPPDAVFCYNDLIAVGAMRGVLAAGLRIPQDIAIIGCGNLRLADYLQVPLTSLDQVTNEQGEQAARLIVSLVAGRQADAPAEIRIAPQVISRASTARSAM
ncbi:MAG: LacI family DNA-binding transcriptional regulator [Janthinobacterium lividum]